MTVFYRASAAGSGTGNYLKNRPPGRLNLHFPIAFFNKIVYIKIPVEDIRSAGHHGEVSEWLKELVSKTSVLVRVS
jgi:hypothetical protein